MVKNLRRLACKFDLHQTEPKAKRSRKLTKSSTCVNLRLRLARALCLVGSFLPPPLSFYWIWIITDGVGSRIEKTENLQNPPTLIISSL